MLAGVTLLALVLRGPIVAVSPVAAAARHDLGVGAVGFGLLTSVPVLCFGLAAPFAVLLIRRLGPERAVLAAIAGVAAGAVVRVLDGYVLALLGTVLLGLGITVGNVVVTTVIRRDVPASARAGATGLFTAGLNVGTMLTAAGTAPLALLVGWRVATAASAVVAIAAAVVWIALLRRRRAFLDADAGGGGVPAAEEGLRRSALPLVLLLSVTFAAQAFSYYGLTAWLPTLLAEERHLGAASAGLASSIFQISAVLGAFGVPALLPRLGTWRTVLIVGLLWCALPAGLLVAPQSFALWSVLGGAAQGGGFVVIFAVIVRVATSGRAATTMSAAVQSAGYVIAAVAPPLLGLLRAGSGGWSLPLAVVLGATTVFTVVGCAAALRSDRPETRVVAAPTSAS